MPPIRELMIVLLMIVAVPLVSQSYWLEIAMRYVELAQSSPSVTLAEVQHTVHSAGARQATSATRESTLLGIFGPPDDPQ